jgi:hypothetical protein
MFMRETEREGNRERDKRCRGGKTEGRNEKEKGGGFYFATGAVEVERDVATIILGSEPQHYSNHLR